MKVYSQLWVAIVFKALIVITLVSQPSRAAGPWYVAPGGDDSNDCLSAVSPCATIKGAIVKASAGDTIFVAIGTYTGTGLEVVLLDKDATLSGGWDSTFTMQSGISTIDGQGARRGVFVNSGVTASIKLFIVENGAGPTAQGGGGIFNNGGTLTLDDSTIRGSSSLGGTQGGGILNRSGTLTLNNSTVAGNIANIGAGIYSDGIGTAVLNNSTVVGNSSSGQGGGIYNLASILYLTNSTVSNNSASIRGGGIYSDPPAAVTLTNTTISGNRAGLDGGGIYHTGNNSIMILNNSSISTNTASDGGGIYTGGGVDSFVRLRNTILARNVASINADCRAPSVTPTSSEGYNLIGDTSGCAFTPVIGDLTDIDPLLGPLQDNGGPTFTHALLPGSPAIDAGSPDCPPPATDQRGVPRPQGAACDIGAFELEAVAMAVKWTTRTR